MSRDQGPSNQRDEEVDSRKKASNKQASKELKHNILYQHDTSSSSTSYTNKEPTVGWIYALPIAMAAKGIMDEVYGDPQTPTQ